MNSKDFREKARTWLEGKWKPAILMALIYTLFICILNASASYEGRVIFFRFFTPIISLAMIVISPALWYGITSAYMKLKKGENVAPFDFLKLGFENFGRAWGLVGNILLKCLPYVIISIALLVILVIVASAMVGLGLLGYNATASGTNISDEFITMFATSSIWLVVITLILLVAVIVVYVLFAIKALYYTLATYIAVDNPEVTTKEAVQRSEDLMKDNRFRYFCLMFSFIGWMLLAGIVGGLLMKIVNPIGLSLLTTFVSELGMIVLMPYVTFSTIAFYEDRIGGKKEVKTEVVETSSEEQK